MKSRNYIYECVVAAIFLVGLCIPIFANCFVASADYYSIWTKSYWDGVKKLSQKENLLYRPLILSMFTVF